MNSNKLNRRQFLKIIAASSAFGLIWKFGLENLSAVEVISETRLLMGTIINLTVISENPNSVATAIDTCLNRMSGLEKILSRFQPESQLSILNQFGELNDAHPALLGLVAQSMELSQLTGGAFDITVKPLLDLYQSTPGSLPSSSQIDQALNLVGSSNIDLAGERIAFQQAGVSITLDGIAKGYIVDEGVNVLKELGFENILVEAGGDLMGLGEKQPHTPWKIGLQAPRGKIGDLITSLGIRDQAIATSGDYMQTFTPDFSNHHIIDPRTGHSSPELASVSIVAPTTSLADALATAVMVMGRSGLDLIDTIDGCEAFAVSKIMDEYRTTGFLVN